MMFNTLITLVLSKPIFAAANNIADDCRGADILGLHTWYYYLPQSYFDGCTIKTFHFLPSGSQADIALVLLAIIDDLLRIAGVVAVAYVIVGAFKYVASQGNPEATGRAQGTIINALVGLAIAITAAVFINFLGQRLGGG